MKRFFEADDEKGFHTTADGRRFYTPGLFWPKLGFLLVGMVVMAVGLLMMWDPLVSFVFGERASARVTRIVRSEPGVPPRVILYRQTIPEGSEATRFTYYVTVEEEDGTQRVMQMGVGSRREAYANINDEIDVIYRADGEIAFGLFHHRTWAFGVGFFFTGFVLTICAIPTLLAVGKPIEVDPEAPPDET